METEMHSMENCPWQKKYSDLEEKHNQMAQNLQMSAIYGKSLLEEQQTLKQQIKDGHLCREKMIQENHNLKMQLEISQKSCLSQLQEIETLKESAAGSEDVVKLLKQQEEEKYRKENQLIADLACLKDQTLTQKGEYEAKINELEAELQQLKSAERPSITMNCDHEDEIAQLQMQLEISSDSNSKLEEKLFATQNQLLQLQQSEKQLRSQQNEADYELQKKEKELAAAEKLVEEKRVEVLELQALLEAERVSQTNPDKRGNSIFSEVEDRRQQVERHLTIATGQLEREKKKNADLQAEVVKVKNQLAYAAFGGTGPDQSKHVEQLESLLRSANTQNQDLLKRLDQADKAASTSTVLMPQLEDTRQWMKAMLAQEKDENVRLRAEIRGHIRSNLCQNEQMIVMSRRLNENEKNLQRARAEVVRLKIKIDEMAVNENIPKTSPQRSAPSGHRVVENLKFMLDKKEVESLKSDQPLKERVVRQSAADAIDPLAASKNPSTVLISSDAPCSAPAPESDFRDQVIGSADLVAPEVSSDCKSATATSSCNPKRQVRMNSDVRVVFDDGDSTLESLCMEDKFTAGAKKSSKPQGKQVQVIDTTQATPVMECNQQ